MKLIERIIKSRDEFRTFAGRVEGQGIVEQAYLVKIKTSYTTCMNIIWDILDEKEIRKFSSREALSLMIFEFYGESRNLKSIESMLKQRVTHNCTIAYGTDEPLLGPQYIFFHFDSELNPLISFFLHFSEWNTYIDNVMIKARINTPTTTDILDIVTLHNYFLLCCKIKKYCNSCALFFYIPVTNVNNEFRLRAYLSNLELYGIEVKLNDQVLNFNQKNLVLGMLFPALYVETLDDYKFLKQPLNDELWNIIQNKQHEKLMSDEFRKKTPVKFIPYLSLCMHFFFDEFEDNNHSREYTELREKAFSSETFHKEYVRVIPFLALFLFAIYDNYYRSESLRKFKEEIGRNKLENSDCKLSLQGEQKRERFEAYRKLKKQNYDIKNLIDDGPKTDSEPIFQKTVIAEIFECVSIAEGLLQILENAVIHAGGGLMSMRIYSRAKKQIKQKKANENMQNCEQETEEYIRPHNVAYLNETYGKSYFDYLNTLFFLEVQLSDFSEMSMPEKYISNIKNYRDITFSYELMNKINQTVQSLFSELPAREELKTLPDCEKEEKLRDSKRELNNILDKQLKKMRINYFFSDEIDDKTEDKISLKDFKKCYFSISEGVVHHYGLETFNSIITARNGLFSVCGHNDYYSNANSIIDDAYRWIESLIETRLINNAYEKYKEPFLRTIEAGKEEDKALLRKTFERNERLSGTFYKILLPLKHTRANIPGSVDEPEEESDVDLSQKDFVYIDSLPSNMNEPSTSIVIKQRKINDFAKHIETEYKKNNDKYLAEEKKEPLFKPVVITCINIWKILHEISDEPPAPDLFESIIKGTLLFAFRQKNNEERVETPIAIINLTPFQFIEAARIIAVCTRKDDYKIASSEESGFEKIPIYLKSVSKFKDKGFVEMVFSGRNLHDIRETMIRTAMKSGSMCDELDTIAYILEKLQQRTNKGGS